MSLPSSSSPVPGVRYRKPQADLYTMLLLISLAAIIIGTVFIALEPADCGSPPWKDAPSVMLRVDRAAGLAWNAPPDGRLSRAGLTVS